MYIDFIQVEFLKLVISSFNVHVHVYTFLQNTFTEYHCASGNMRNKSTWFLFSSEWHTFSYAKWQKFFFSERFDIFSQYLLFDKDFPSSLVSLNGMYKEEQFQSCQNGWSWSLGLCEYHLGIYIHLDIPYRRKTTTALSKFFKMHNKP